MTSSKPNFQHVGLSTSVVVLVVWVPNMIVVGLEFGTVFVERDSMTEIADRRIGGCKREGTRRCSDRANCIPAPRNTVGAKLVRHVEEEAYHTPTNSISTSIEKAFLNAMLCSNPVRSSRLNVLYANGICWRSPAGRRPTCNRSV